MRGPASSHLASFQQEFIRWRQSGSGRVSGSGVAVGVALERWLAQFPEHAELIQQLALGAAFNAAMLEDWDSGRRIAGVGLNATLLGALSSEERLASATMLGFVAARSALRLGDTLAARTVLERALDTLRHMDAYSPLASYLQLQRHLLSAELSESSLETMSAASGYERAVELVDALVANRRRARELEAAWLAVAFGQLPEGSEGASHELWEHETRTARRLAVLGLARTSSSEEASRDAIRLCVEDGLPLADTVLAIHGVLTTLPREESDDAADGLLELAAALEERYRNTWILAIRSFQAEALLEHGDPEAAQNVVDAIELELLRGADAIAMSLAFAARARVALELAPGATARSAVETLLSLHSYTVERLQRTAHQLRFRAACERTLREATRAELAELRSEQTAVTRRRLSLLLDALRAPEATPPALMSSSDGVRRALDCATDRLGRLVAAVGGRSATSETLVLIIQGVDEGTAFICVGGSADEPIVVTAPDAAAGDALTSLAEVAERSILEGASDFDVEAAGRTAFDALPAVVRERMLRARTLVVVPDFADGQDRVPIELLHDGAQFIGLSKVVARCLSLSHALHALEAPLASPIAGRRALCASVAEPPGLPALRFANEEIGTVSDVLRGAMWDATPVRDSNADPRSILELAPLANVLHIACHGEASAGAEALVLGDGMRLDAAEIATRHRLRGVVYLNACSLAQGRYLGGGVSRGVAYAFVKAGAPCVIANLLPVEDEGAARLSATFYALAREHPVGEAMRRARAQLAGSVSAALLTGSVLIGNPFVMLGRDEEPFDDATSRLFRDVPAPDRPPELSASFEQIDPRFMAAVALARATPDADVDELDALASVARDLGHDVGEAQCRITLVKRLRFSSDREALVKALRGAVAALEPLRGVWEPAFEAHQEAQAALRALDPGYEERKLTTVRMESGLTVNDRSNPAVDAFLRMTEAVEDHESHWRGEPVLRAPDGDATSIAHNAVIWGYLNRVSGTGAEAGVASAFAARAAWLGLVADDAVPHLQRILTGLLCFLWGQQKVRHLEHWMAGAHRDVIGIAIERVKQHWTEPANSPALGATHEIATLLDGAFVKQATGSRFAQARAAMRSPDSAAPQLDDIRSRIDSSIRALHAIDPYAGADFGAWVFGDLQARAATALAGPDVRRDVALSCTTLYEAFRHLEEGIYMPYLMDGFKATRESGGQDLFATWSNALL